MFLHCKLLLASAARHALVGPSCIFSDERNGHLYARPSTLRRRKATLRYASEHATDGLSIHAVSGRVNGSHRFFTVNEEVQANSALRQSITGKEILKQVRNAVRISAITCAAFPTARLVVEARAPESGELASMTALVALVDEEDVELAVRSEVFERATQAVGFGLCQSNAWSFELPLPDSETRIFA